MFFSFSSSAKGQTTQTTPLMKLGKKRRESSKRNYSARVIMETTIISASETAFPDFRSDFLVAQLPPKRYFGFYFTGFYYWKQ